MEQKIIVFGGEKGGTGKSTFATNFACILAGKGFRVLLVDADEQQTATKFTATRNEDQPNAPQYACIKLVDKAVRTEIQKIRHNYEYIIVDTGGRDTSSQRAALAIAHILMAPFAPRDFDLDTCDKVETIISEMQIANPGLHAYCFINSADPEGQGSENEDAAGKLRKRQILQYIDAPVGRRKAFSHAASLGLAVTELPRKYRSEQAVEEIVTLFQRCIDVRLTLQEAV